MKVTLTKRLFEKTTDWQNKISSNKDPLLNALILKTIKVLTSAEENQKFSKIPIQTYRNNTYVSWLHEQLLKETESSSSKDIKLLLQRGCELGVFPIDSFPKTQIEIPLSTAKWKESRQEAFYGYPGAYMSQAPALETLLKRTYSVLGRGQQNQGKEQLQTWKNNSYIEKLHQELIEAMSLPGAGLPGEVSILLNSGRVLGVFPSNQEYLIELSQRPQTEGQKEFMEQLQILRSKNSRRISNFFTKILRIVSGA